MTIRINPASENFEYGKETSNVLDKKAKDAESTVKKIMDDVSKDKKPEEINTKVNKITEPLKENLKKEKTTLVALAYATKKQLAMLDKVDIHQDLAVNTANFFQKTVNNNKYITVEWATNEVQKATNEVQKEEGELNIAQQNLKDAKKTEEVTDKNLKEARKARNSAVIKKVFSFWKKWEPLKEVRSVVKKAKAEEKEGDKEKKEANKNTRKETWELKDDKKDLRKDTKILEKATTKTENFIEENGEAKATEQVNLTKTTLEATLKSFTDLWCTDEEIANFQLDHEIITDDDNLKTTYLSLFADGNIPQTYEAGKNPKFDAYYQERYTDKTQYFFSAEQFHTALYKEYQKQQEKTQPEIQKENLVASSENIEAAFENFDKEHILAMIETKYPEDLSIFAYSKNNYDQYLSPTVEKLKTLKTKENINKEYLLQLVQLLKNGDTKEFQKVAYNGKVSEKYGDKRNDGKFGPETQAMAELYVTENVLSSEDKTMLDEALSMSTAEKKQATVTEGTADITQQGTKVEKEKTKEELDKENINEFNKKILQKIDINISWSDISLKKEKRVLGMFGWDKKAVEFKKIDDGGVVVRNTTNDDVWTFYIRGVDTNTGNLLLKKVDDKFRNITTDTKELAIEKDLISTKTEIDKKNMITQLESLPQQDNLTTVATTPKIYGDIELPTA